MDRRLFTQYLGTFLVLANTGCADDAQKLQTEVQNIASRYGVTVGLGDATSFFVPPYRVEEGLLPGYVATRVQPDRAFIALAEIGQELPKYPDHFFASLCPAIFLCDSLRMDGAPAGGTYGPNWLILTAGSAMSEASVRETIRLGIHHEFSSLIFNGDAQVQSQWTTQMPKDWAPVLTDAQALARNTDKPPALASGLLSAYAATSTENDFNTYAETVFTQAAKLKSLCEAHPVVTRKTALLLAAYRRRDPRFGTLFDQWGFEAVQKITVDLGDRVSPVKIGIGQIVENAPPPAPAPAAN